MNNQKQLFRRAVKLVQVGNFLTKSVNEHDINKIIEILQKKQDKSEEEINIISEFFQNAHYFTKIKNKYNNEFYHELCRHLYFISIPAKQQIQVGRTTYIIINGRVLVEKEQKEELAFLDSFNQFGLNDIQRCSAWTIRDTQLACLDFKVFQEINQSMKSSDNVQKIAFLKLNSVFQLFSENELRFICYHLETLKFLKNHQIIQEDEEDCESVYFLKSGELSLSKEKTYISKLHDGEMFGEEGFLLYNQRQFTVTCNSESCVVYRIYTDELEKRVWQEESRNILFEQITSKLLFRLQRFFNTKNIDNPDVDKVKEHLKNLSSLLVPNRQEKIYLQFEKHQIQDQEVPVEIDTKERLTGCSSVLKNMRHAQGVLQYIYKTDQCNQQILLEKDQTKLADRYPKLITTPKRKNLVYTKSNKSVNQRKVTSNYNYLNCDKESLIQKLNNFLSIQTINDEEINWGDNGTQVDRKDKMDQFYSAFEAYSHKLYYQNQNFMESSSSKSKQLNKEYKELVEEQQKNIKNVFQIESKQKSDNQLRKEYFLRQLKKMQKRLQVLQMIKKGLLVCKYNQYVNDDGEIVDYHEERGDMDHEIVNGKKQFLFNFVTEEQMQRNKKSKFKDFDIQISEQKEHIHQVKEIVYGNLDPTTVVPEMHQDFLKQHHREQKPTQSHPTFITNYTKQQRITSASFKSELFSIHSQGMSIKNFST